MTASLDQPDRSSAYDGSDPGPNLPPVQPPTARVFLQLVVIPAIIVSVVVFIYMGFSWLAHVGRDDPKSIIRQLKRLDDSSWQRAHELADMLRSRDPQYDTLRRDASLCAELVELLEADLEAAKGEPASDVRLKRRMFLCRAIGSFQIDDGLPVLLRCVQRTSGQEANVALSGLEAISTLAVNIGPEKIRQNEEAMKVILASSQAADESEPPTGGEQSAYRPQGEVRAAAAFTLGVIGGEEAKSRLREMQIDLYPGARYNAATGLARLGDEQCIPVLRQMLLPDNKLAAQDERYEREKDFKRVTVLRNGIQASVMLAEKNPEADLAPLETSLAALAASDLAAIKTDRGKLQGMAKEALRLLKRKK